MRTAISTIRHEVIVTNPPLHLIHTDYQCKDIKQRSTPCPSQVSWKMFLGVFLLLTGGVSIASTLSCYSCPSAQLDFWVDAKSVPPFSSNCSVIEAKKQCSTTIRWEETGPTRKTSVNYLGDFDFDLLPKDSSLFFVFIDLERELQTKSSRALLYSCTTDRCNDRASLQRVFDALTLDENFAPLDELFSNNTAAFADQESCVDFANSTHLDCPASASSRPECAGCFLLAMDSTGEVCARCPQELPTLRLDLLNRRVLFFPENRTRLAEKSELVCRTKGCNALDNVHRIHQLSKLEFDFEKFFASAASPLIVSVLPFLLLALTFV